MSVIVNDLLMLGKTVPEPQSDGRQFVCSAGWTPDLGLIRVYPLARKHSPKRWTTHSVELRRNPKDHRRESWQIAGDRDSDAHPDINHRFTQSGQWSRGKRGELLDRYRGPSSIAEANEQRASLALIRPERMSFHLEFNPDSPDSPQLSLFDTDKPAPIGAKRFPHIPRLRFNDGTDHDLMLRDWGVYEQMRHFPGREKEIPEFLHLGPSSHLLVGNLNAHRKAWLVISVLNINAAQMTLEMSA
jgi:hypothetical protein